MSQEVFELTKNWVISKLPKRPKDANKGTFGKALVVAGSENYPGAAYLACAAIYRIGAGLVTLVTTSTVKIIVSKKLPEVTFLSYNEVLERLSEYDVLLFGSGLGQKQVTVKFIEKLLKEKLPKTIIDGDGLNILSRMGNWWEDLQSEIILTPHMGEMSRLTGLSIDKIQKRRIDIAQEFANKWGKVVVLKGANSVLVSPAGEVMISPFTNPLLSTAGTGDVLSGVIAGLLAQGLDSFDASCLGVYVHGMAGETLKEKLDDAGLLASELLPVLPLAVKQLKEKRS